MATQTRPKAERARRVPGEEGVWILILGDMLMFAVLFGVFVHAHAADPREFDASRRLLNQDYGAINTLLLLTSSLLVVTAVRAVRAQLAIAPRLFLGAMVCGSGFIAVKALEWTSELSAGHVPGDNQFFTYYYALTGLHFFHLLLGMGVLTFLWRQARNADGLTEQRLALVEGGACFWHMVDLLWIVLFPLIYLLH